MYCVVFSVLQRDNVTPRSRMSNFVWAELGFCRNLWLLIRSFCCCRTLKASTTVELQEEKGESQTSSNLSCNFLVALRFHGHCDIWGVDFEFLKYGEEEKSKI